MLLPLLFSLVYLAWKLHLVTDVRIFDKDVVNVVTLACSVGGLALAILKYVSDHRTRSGKVQTMQLR
jgi:hypothetical protein